MKKGQIAHLDQDSSNSDIVNLVWLCFDHHDEYDSRTSQSKGLQKSEVTFYRDELYLWRDNQRKLSVTPDASTIDAEARRNRIKLVEDAIKQIDREISNLETYLSGKTAFKDEYHYRAVMVYPFELVSETMNELSNANFVDYDFQKVALLADVQNAEKLVQMLPTLISTLEAELAKLKYS